MTPGRRITVSVPGGARVAAIVTAAARPRWTFVYAPGAGSSIDDPFGLFLLGALPPNGVSLVRFEFPYMAAGRRSPDRPAILEAAWGAVLSRVRDDGTKVVAGGRSMGGRVASQAVAGGEQVDALALFAYPLHPPGKPAVMRDEHFSAIDVPMLFCCGTRDAFASPAELRDLKRRLGRRASLHLLDGADHGFRVPRSSGRAREDVWREAADAFIRWLSTIP